MKALHGKALLTVLILGLIAVSLQACDMGTVMHQRSQLSRPIPGDCIESALISKGRTIRRLSPEQLSRSVINDWSVSGEFIGGVNQSRQDDETVFLEVRSFWMGSPGLDWEWRLENSMRDVMDEIKLKCETESNKFKDLGCDYRSFGSYEKRCPSKRP